MNRLVTAVVSVALLGFTPVALAPGAVASEAKVASTVSATPDARVSTRSITMNAYRIGRQAYVRGLVRPRYARKPVVVQKGRCNDGACTFKFYKKVRTNARSKYSAKVFVPARGKVVYRIMVPRSGGYATSYSVAKSLYWT